MSYTNRPGTGPLDLQMRTHIAAAEIVLTAAIAATSDECTRETYRGLLNLLMLAADSVPSERPALLDEVLRVSRFLPPVGCLFEAVAALVDLDRAAVWVLEHHAAAPGHLLVIAKDGRFQLGQVCRDGVERVDVEAGERASGCAAARCVAICLSRIDSEVDGSQFAGVVKWPIVVFFVFQRDADRSIEVGSPRAISREDDNGS